MAPWVFAAPAVAFALLPSVVVAAHATDGIALTAMVAVLASLAGASSFSRWRERLRRRRRGQPCPTLGLVVMVGGLALSALTAGEHRTWLLLPSAIVLGMAYGLCLVFGLVEVQRMADPEALAGLTAIFYVLTYLGFAVPYVLALAAQLTSSPRSC